MTSARTHNCNIYLNVWKTATENSRILYTDSSDPNKHRYTHHAAISETNQYRYMQENLSK